MTQPYLRFNVTRMIGKLKRAQPVELRDMQFLRRNTDPPAKITLPGPFTMTADTTARQISIEAAQPRLDLGVLRDLAGKKVMLGVLDLGDPAVETPGKVAERIRAALRYMKAEDLIPAPDCGMKYLSREVAFGKLKALAEGARIVRAEVS